MDGSNSLPTCMELGDVVLDDSVSGGVETECCIEWCGVTNIGRCSCYQMLPVSHGTATIPESQQDVTKKDLPGILASLTHDLIQDNGTIKLLICSTAKVRERRTRHHGVQWHVHHRRKLTKVSEQQDRASSKELVGSVRKHLPQTGVDLSKDLSPYHGHFIDDEVCHG
jgi:hypothetical protein